MIIRLIGTRKYFENLIKTLEETIDFFKFKIDTDPIEKLIVVLYEALE